MRSNALAACSTKRENFTHHGLFIMSLLQACIFHIWFFKHGAQEGYHG